MSSFYKELSLNPNIPKGYTLVGKLVLPVTSAHLSPSGTPISSYLDERLLDSISTKVFGMSFIESNAAMYEYMGDKYGAKTIEQAHELLLLGKVKPSVVEAWIKLGFIDNHEVAECIKAGYPDMDFNGLLLENLVGSFK